MANNYFEKLEVIRLLTKELNKELSELNEEFHVDYKIDMQVQDKKGYTIVSTTESSNWSASWC